MKLTTVGRLPINFSGHFANSGQRFDQSQKTCWISLTTWSGFVQNSELPKTRFEIWGEKCILFLANVDPNVVRNQLEDWSWKFDHHFRSFRKWQIRTDFVSDWGNEVDFRWRHLESGSQDCPSFSEPLASWLFSFRNAWSRTNTSYISDLDKLKLDCWFGVRLETVFYCPSCPQKMFFT